MSDQATRGRGRPRAEEGLDGRAAILTATGEEFAERGYAGTSLRGVAKRAGVDPALVHHYFGDKTGLFSAILDAPDAIQEGFLRILDGPRDVLAADYVRFALTLYEDPAQREQMTALIRTSLGSGGMADLAKVFVADEVNERFAAIAAGPDAAFRAELVSAQLLGLFTVRYVLALEPIASASIDEVVARVAPTIHRYLFED